MFYSLAPLPVWAHNVVEALTKGGVPTTELKNSQKRLARFEGRPARTREETT